MSGPTTVEEVMREYHRLRTLSDRAVLEVKQRNHLLAEAERDLTRAESLAWAQGPDGRTAKQREVQVKDKIADYTFVRDLAEADVKTAVLAVRNYDRQISFLTTSLAVLRDELKLARGPEFAA